MPDDDEVAKIAENLDDAKVRNDLIEATNGKVDRRLLIGGGLDGIRLLVGATADVAGSEISTAYEFCLEIIRKRFFNGSDRLHSWSWLGLTLFGRIYEGMDLDEGPNEYLSPF